MRTLGKVLVTSLMTGIFCAGFALVVELLTDMLEAQQIAVLSFTSGFTGSLVAQFIMKFRK
ncbi:MAG: hypothetical protein P8Q92_01475 [Pseudoprimorskyibacter sp.]|nr:hypothetical protein [Pseudoprimorskyibacter sp.]